MITRAESDKARHNACTSGKSGIAATVNGLLEEQAKGNVGTAYWTANAMTSQFYAPRNWKIVDSTVSECDARVTVRVESSNEAGSPIIGLWVFRVEYEKSWKVSSITKKL